MRQQIMDGPTSRLSNLEVHLTYIEPGKAAHPPHTHTDTEELLIVKEGQLKVTIAGKDKIFHPAMAYISGSTVTVTSPLVKEPVAVRYAFRDFIEGDLFGTNGLPVSSFRTDDW